ncbi:alcohol oxidase [Thozetella sp. PMI_491]|nr:alcohol oxidase [Thozetella sp. PMI_491]
MFLPLSTLVLGASVLVGAADPYDYIIVGGGTAGLALATRLSNGLAKSKILVLEAGQAALDELRINVPGLRGSTLGSVYDWNFTSIPQENLAGRVIDVNRGKVLGGSSALNYLCYNRAAAAEYDAWGQLGNEGWGWEVMIQAMVKSENFTGEGHDRHGRSGPIRNTYNRAIPEILSLWKPTVTKLGVPINGEGSLGGNPIGVMYQPTNIDTTHWNRSYSANSYLPLAGPNLEVRTGAQVAKVEFAKAADGKPLRAIGVVLEDGTKISAGKEVILSAGAIQSPGLLELSGIGQPAVLKAAGITPLLELPGVGENYQDHVRVSNTYRLPANASSMDTFVWEGTGAQAQEQIKLWIEGKYSQYDYTSTAYAFLTWDQVTSNSSVADLTRLAKEAAGKNGTVVDQKKIELMGNSSVPQLELLFENNYVSAQNYPGGKFVTIFSTLMHPMSRGYVHIDPKSPLGKPIIDPKYLSNEHDVRGVIEGIKFVRKIAQTAPLSARWETEVDPGMSVQTDAQLREFARKNVLSFFHPVGTCAMLPKKDGGVVDASLVVHGTSNLRVVDNSIMPVLLSAHIQTAAYGIAEVAADIIIRASKR